MIVTRQKTLEQILKMLDGKKKIFIIGCGDCAATCKTGGDEEVRQMSDFLTQRGKEITGCAVPEDTCVSAKTKNALAKFSVQLKTSDAVLVLACGSGVQCVKENDRTHCEIFPGCDSLFAAFIDKDNVLKEVCSACGACVLELTEGVCPVTRCSKGLLNGPCGGQDKGKCEADKTKDCAWILIYNRLKEKGKVENLKKTLPPKDASRSKKPGIVLKK